MAFPFEKLDVYQRALRFVGDVEKLCRSLKGKVAYPILDQLTRAAISIPLNIAEGSLRRSTKERLQFLRVARGSLFETAAVVQVLRTANHVNVETYTSLYEELEVQAKMLTGLARFIADNDIRR